MVMFITFLKCVLWFITVFMYVHLVVSVVIITIEKKGFIEAFRMWVPSAALAILMILP